MTSPRNLCLPQGWKNSLCFSSNFISWAFIFGSVTHTELIFICGVKVLFFSPPNGCSIVPIPFVEEIFFPYFISLTLSVKPHWTVSVGPCAASVPFRPPGHPPFHQPQLSRLLWLCGHSGNNGRKSPKSVLLFNIVWVILCSLPFHINFKIICQRKKRFAGLSNKWIWSIWKNWHFNNIETIDP